MNTEWGASAINGSVAEFKGGDLDCPNGVDNDESVRDPGVTLILTVKMYRAV